MSPSLPQRLKVNGIVEALFEARFIANELPEIIVARLTDWKTWKRYRKEMLPVSNIPVAIRAQDPGLRIQPTIQLVNHDGNDIVKIGGGVISLHINKPYPGWVAFREKLSDLFEAIFEKIEEVRIERLGLRYINALNPDPLLISQINQLKFSCTISEKKISEVNINYVEDQGDNFRTLVRLSSPFFVAGKLPENSSAIIDIDTFSTSEPQNNVEHLVEWVEKAHDFTKKAFFELLPDDVIEELRED